jgi:stage II sporulation SpoAA-like protein
MIDMQLFQKEADTLLLCNLEGEVTRQEYSVFIPSFESEIRFIPDLRVFFDLTRFEGWCPGTPWRKLSFNSRHRTHLEKIAIVGLTRRAMWLERACRPLSCKQIRRFSPHRSEVAWTWIGT